MPPSPPSAATNRYRRQLPSVSVVVSIRRPDGLPLLLRSLPPVDEVIVVDSGPAADVPGAVRAARPDAQVIRPARDGAGNALALNGDGSTDPAEIPRYVAALTGGADVALGSRYRDGGRNLTDGRFRRWADLLLIRIVNALFGTRRTDPGFGYAAFWRDAIDRLQLPDPTGAAAAWGDGPEFGPLLALRPEVCGLRVAEVGSVAYPRMRRPARTERARLRHWIRVVAGEYARRSHASGGPVLTMRPSTEPARATRSGAAASIFALSSFSAK